MPSIFIALRCSALRQERRLPSHMRCATPSVCQSSFFMALTPSAEIVDSRPNSGRWPRR
jgi:hypothetical protein